jgi:hypothetical protein
MSTGFDGKSEAEIFARHQQLMAEKPWFQDQHYFKNCRMTRLALMKIWSHAHEGALNTENGTPCEIVGILLGYVADEAVSSPNDLLCFARQACMPIENCLFRSLLPMSLRALTLELGTQSKCLNPVYFTWKLF